ncbi:MAG: hypothetical protein ABIN48_08030 [Ginsengibacter sp.]
MSPLLQLRISFVFVMILSSLTINAQIFNLSWADETKMKYDFDDAVHLDDGEMLVLKLKEKKNFGRLPTSIPVLMLVNDKKETIRENELPVGENYPVFVGLEKLGKHIYLVYENFDFLKRITTVYFIEINLSDLTYGTKKEISSYKGQRMQYGTPYKFSLSPDTSKFMVFVELPQKLRNNEQFSITVFDNALKEIWNQEVELPVRYKFITIYDQEISNEGNVFVSLKQYEKELSGKKSGEDEDGFSPYSFKIFSFSKDRKQNKEVLLKLDGKFVHGAKLAYNENGTVTAAGLYKNVHNGSISGAFFTSFEAVNPVIAKPKIVPFPKDLIVQMIKDGFGGKKSDPGLSTYFKTKHILIRNNGSVDMISEYFKEIEFVTTNIVSGNRSIADNTSFGSIINVNIEESGSVVFTRIPKNQGVLGIEPYAGYYPLILNDKLIIVYNDSKNSLTRDLGQKPSVINNYKKSVLIAGIIDEKGILTRQSIYENNDEDFITVPRHMSKISESNYLITANYNKLTKKRTRYGILKVTN